MKQQKKRWLVTVIVLSVFLILAGGSLGGDDDGDAATEDPQVSETEQEVLEPEEDEADLEVEPEPDPEPIPDPIVYEGSGDDVIAVEKPEDGPLTLYIRGNDSERHMAVQGYNDNEQSTTLFVNTTNVYEGITIDPSGETTMLEINATAQWIIESRSVRQSRTIEVPGNIQGTGDEVLLVEGDASIAKIIGNEQERHFAIKGYNPSANLMVNTTDQYDGTVRVANNTFILEIAAEGDWEIVLE